MSIANLSIIIPTFNRKETLKKTLNAYLNQTASREIREVLVVDDGSRDGTSDAVLEVSKGSSVPIRYFRQMENRGPAAARNVGIHEARGTILLFGDDDIVPTPTLVAEHTAWHAACPDIATGVLGQVVWAPELHPTPFMEWLGLDGPVCGYARLSPDQEVGDQCNYFGLTSVKACLLQRNMFFDEELRFYEDFELIFRLRKRGFRLLYNPRAVGYHYKWMTFSDARGRARASALAFKTLGTKEAGISLKEQAKPKSRMVRMAKRSRQLLKPIIYTLRPLFLPLLPPVLDSRIPLPWTAYRIFYRLFVEMT